MVEACSSIELGVTLVATEGSTIGTGPTGGGVTSKNGNLAKGIVIVVSSRVMGVTGMVAGSGLHDAGVATVSSMATLSTVSLCSKF